MTPAHEALQILAVAQYGSERLTAFLKLSCSAFFLNPVTTNVFDKIHHRSDS
jgi:hypothetical protein